MEQKVSDVYVHPKTAVESIKMCLLLNSWFQDQLLLIYPHFYYPSKIRKQSHKMIPKEEKEPENEWNGAEIILPFKPMKFKILD